MLSMLETTSHQGRARDRASCASFFHSVRTTISIKIENIYNQTLDVIHVIMTTPYKLALESMTQYRCKGAEAVIFAEEGEKVKLYV